MSLDMWRSFTPRAQRWAAIGPLAAGLLVLGLANATAWGVITIAESKGRLEYRARTQETLVRIRDRLDRELQTVLGVPETVAAFVAAQGKLEPELFTAVVARLVDTNKHVRNVALAPDNVIQTVYPLAGNERVIGLRYMDVPAQRAAVQRAIESRRTVVAGPFKLVQGGMGISSRTPVFRTPQVVGGGGEPYWGIVSLTVNADSLFTEAGLQNSTPGFDVAARGSDATGARGAAFAGSEQVFTRDAVVLDYPLPGGGSWQLGAVPSGGWESVGKVPVIVSVFAYLLAFLVGLLSYRLMVSRQRILELAVHDRLTGLPNRRLFDDRLSQAVGAARRHGRVGALLLIDLDRFKPVNDLYGHLAGDLVLVRAGQRLAGLVRGSDSVSRLGGDEFAVILQEINAPDEAVLIAGRAIESLNEPVYLPDGRSAVVGASVGVAVFPDGLESLTALFERADRALYASKKKGGASVSLDTGAVAQAAGRQENATASMPAPSSAHSGE